MPRGRPGGPRRPGPVRRRPSERAPERAPRREPPKGLGGEQIEGRHAVRELLAAGRRRVREVWVAEGGEAAALLAEIVDLAAARRVPLKRVARGRLEGAARTDAPQGVLARAEPLPEVDLADLAGPDSFLLCLDGVTDPHNLGALLRTAECAGVTGVVLPKHRSAHVTPAAAKAAAGAIEHLAFAVEPGVPSALRRLRQLGVWTVGLAGEADRSLFDLDPDLARGPVALVLGAEGTGLSRLARERCDLLVSIPQRGVTASLNVAAAGAVACFELARRRRG